MNIRCTLCNQMNKVAGFYYEDKNSKKAEGVANQSLYCGFCGGQFQPGPEPLKEEKTQEVQPGA